MSDLMCVPTNAWNTMLDDFRLSHPELAREYEEKASPVMNYFVWTDQDAHPRVRYAVEDGTITEEQADECLKYLMEECSGIDYIGEKVIEEIDDDIVRWAERQKEEAEQPNNSPE